jgi:hypothetical protein
MIAFALQNGKRFFTIDGNMDLAGASRVAQGRKREVNIGRIVLYKQYSNRSLAHRS